MEYFLIAIYSIALFFWVREIVRQILKRPPIVELPCEIGADVWWIDEETQTVQCHKNGVYDIIVKSDGVFVMYSAECIDKIGTKWCYLTKEDAEKALKERVKTDAND